MGLTLNLPQGKYPWVYFLLQGKASQCHVLKKPLRHSTLKLQSPRSLDCEKTNMGSMKERVAQSLLSSRCHFGWCPAANFLNRQSILSSKTRPQSHGHTRLWPCTEYLQRGASPANWKMLFQMHYFSIFVSPLPFPLSGILTKLNGEVNHTLN